MEVTAPRVEPGMEVRLRGKHPCGADRFRVVRVGADIGLICLGCGHKLFLERRRFEVRVKRDLRR